MKTIQLQSVGRVPATVAKNIVVGSKLMWNFGYVNEVIQVEYSKTGKTMVITEKTPEGKEYKRRLGINRLVAII